MMERRPTHLLARLRAALTGECGLTTLQSAILTPAILVMTFTVIQAGLYYHARNVAISAAQVGVDTARTYDSSSGAGRSAASSYLSQVAGGLFQNVSVSASRSGSTASVQVNATYQSVVPGLSLPAIVARAQAPVERVTVP